MSIPLAAIAIIVMAVGAIEAAANQWDRAVVSIFISLLTALVACKRPSN